MTFLHLEEVNLIIACSFHKANYRPVFSLFAECENSTLFSSFAIPSFHRDYDNLHFNLSGYQ